MWRLSTVGLFRRRGYLTSVSSWLKRALFIPGMGTVDYVRADREISRNRILIALACVLYTLILTVTNRLESRVTLTVMLIYLTLSIIVAKLGLGSKSLMRARRDFTLIFDIVTLSLAFTTAEIFAAPAFLLYLWLVIGYGFRYGIRFLRMASGLSVVGFVVAALTSLHWSQQPYIIASFVATLVIIPIYIELLLRKLLNANERAKDANHAKALMLAGLALELRAPLGYIETTSEHLLRSKLGLVQIDLVNSIQVATRSLKLELDDFVDVSRIEAGRTTVRREKFSTAAAVKDALHMVAAEVHAKSLQMSWHISASVPVALNLDRAHFIKALTNFLDNAVKFTNAGSVSIHLTLVKGLGKAIAVRGEVSDTGIGIEQDSKEKIWQSFTQANRRVLQTYGGAGLGLSVARQLIELMDGRVGVESKLGKGSKFWFEIPITPDKDLASEVSWPPGLAVVLVSPDHGETLSLLHHIRNHGGQVFHADQIRGIIPAVAHASEDIDRLVIMVDGREGDPVQVAYALRFDAALGRVPLILVHQAGWKANAAERQMFVTAVPAFAERNVLLSALLLADNLEDENTMQKPKSTPNADSKSPSSQTLKILIAEKSFSNRLVLTRQLEVAGHVCWAVEDGEQVVAAFAEESFDLVIIAIEAAKMNGFETTQMIRFISPDTLNLPIVGIADDITPGLMQRSIDAGMKTLLARPISTAQIMSLLAECLPVTVSHVGPVDSHPATVEDISAHPKFRADKGPPLKSPSLSHLGLKADRNLLDEVRLAFQGDARMALVHLREAINKRDIEEYHSQLQTVRSAAVTLGASHLEQLCTEGRGYHAESLTMQGRVLLHKIESEFSRVDEMLREEE